MSDFECYRELEGQDASIVAVAFSPDSALIISGTPNGDLRIWDAKFGHGRPLLCQPDAHDLGVTCCEFSPTYGSAGMIYSGLWGGGQILTESWEGH